MSREFAMAVALMALCLLLGALNSDFWASANVLNTVRHIAMLGIFTIGLSFVIITGGIDLSVGSVIGLTGVTVAALITAGVPIGWAVALAMAIGILIGTLQGALITCLGLQPFIVTLG